MMRAAFAGLMAALTFVPAAFAAPPPALPDGTPATIEGYETSLLYRHFIRWTERESSKAVRESVKKTELMLSLGNDVRVLSFSILGHEPYTDAAGGLEQQCDYDPDNMMQFIVGTASLTEEEIAEKCYWRLRLNDATGARPIAQAWIDAFDPQRAANYLKSQGIKPGKDLMSRTIDWSGYQDPAALAKAPALRSNVWTSRTCGSFPAALDQIESISLGNINIRDYGTGGETAPSKPDSPWLTVTAYSINAGAKASIEFSGTAGAPATLIDILDALTDACEPLPPPAQ
ncbi:hypothetical protein WNY37_01300 [Henriciella sp. AS95]|uniref:hypothetical protein n=1 Tax=Henriciella sp. AS95 TaxID=3135782 RepID=UPI003177D0AD